LRNFLSKTRAVRRLVHSFMRSFGLLLRCGADRLRRSCPVWWEGQKTSCRAATELVNQKQTPALFDANELEIIDTVLIAQIQMIAQKHGVCL
jgi:hypothetical protein